MGQTNIQEIPQGDPSGGVGNSRRSRALWNGIKGAWNSDFVQGPNTGDLQATGVQAGADAGTYRALNAPGGEGALAQSYQDTIAGNTPSVAMQALHQQTAQNAAAQLGFASGLGGLNAALARRTAADNTARINQQAIGQGAMLRGQEIQGAQQGLGTTYQNVAQQQLEEEKLREKAYQDQKEIQTKNRENNTKIFGGGLQGLSSAIGL
jgi:hypothetical protein